MSSLKDNIATLVHAPRLIVRSARNFLLRGGKIKRFYETSLSNVDHFNLPVSEIPLHIITVTYNNELLLAQQARLMNKYIEDRFVFIVADNSSDPGKRKKIRDACSNLGLGYISLPPNPYSTSSSSHGVCLNWLIKHYIPNYRPYYFGFIDHDLFPAKKHSIISYLERQPVYGHWQGKKNYWYLWAGMCFFNSKMIVDHKLDFMPASVHGNYADTGGSNWRRLYSKLDETQIKFPSHQYIDLRKGDVPQSDKMELIGEWLHSFNGSYWMKVEAKENVLFDYLNTL